LNSQKFITTIDFQSQNLLDDTVTELIHNSEDENYFANLKDLHFYTREDPTRAIYPSILQFPFLRAINLTELIQEYDISDGGFRVSHQTDKKLYVLKVVNRPFYLPGDSDVIRQELGNLQQLKNVAGIVQPAGVAIFPNPYITNPSDNPETVIYGILLEYYIGGTLQQIFNKQQIKQYNWK